MALKNLGKGNGMPAGGPSIGGGGYASPKPGGAGAVPPSNDFMPDVNQRATRRKGTDTFRNFGKTASSRMLRSR